MKFYIFSFLLIFSVFSCKEEVDLCENVVCNNDGVCNDGTCDCPPEFMGTNCDELSPALAVRITKIIITDFIEDTTSEPWDEDSNPDLFVSIDTSSPFASERTDVIQNAEYGVEHEFVGDWLLERPESTFGQAGVIWPEFYLWDSDDPDFISGSTSELIGRRVLYISNFRDEKPASLDLQLDNSMPLGIRIELEWIFE